MQVSSFIVKLNRSPQLLKMAVSGLTFFYLLQEKINKAAQDALSYIP